MLSKRKFTILWFITIIKNEASCECYIMSWPHLVISQNDPVVTMSI